MSNPDKPADEDLQRVLKELGVGRSAGARDATARAIGAGQQKAAIRERELNDIDEEKWQLFTRRHTGNLLHGPPTRSQLLVTLLLLVLFGAGLISRL